MRCNGWSLSTGDSGRCGALELVPTAAILHPNGIFRSREIFPTNPFTHRRILVSRIYSNIVRWNDGHGLYAACLCNTEDREVTSHGI